MKKITAIIPTYNSAKYITEAIDSVLNQTYANIEIIVVDDGSTDNTENILSNYVNKNKIIYVKKKNGGPGSARNLGIKLANGEYIAFLDADDMWEKNKIEKQLSMALSSSSDLVYTSRYFIK